MQHRNIGIILMLILLSTESTVLPHNLTETLDTGVSTIDSQQATSVTTVKVKMSTIALLQEESTLDSTDASTVSSATESTQANVGTTAGTNEGDQNYEESRNPSPLPGYSFPRVSEVSKLDYIYGPIVVGLSFLSTIVIVVIFMRKSMRSPTTKILTGIVISDTLKSLLRYGNYLYIYVTYGSGTVDIVLPYCIVLFYSDFGENICYSVAQALWACLAVQRVLVIKFPFKSREFLTTKVSILTVVVCVLLGVLYRLPDLFYSGKFTSYRDYLILSGYDPSDFYYYYYYNYYEDGSNVTSGFETYIYSTIYGDEDLCMVYKDPAFTKAFDIYHPICSLIPFLVYLISSIYIIYSIVTRNSSNDIHESKGRMQKIEMMTRSTLIILLVQCIKKAIGVFNLIITFITKMEIYDVWGKMDLDAMRVLFKFREIVSAAAALINFWIIVAACEQFRQEIFNVLTTCCRCQKLVPKASVKK
jgi:hypothetical protein